MHVQIFLRKNHLGEHVADVCWNRKSSICSVCVETVQVANAMGSDHVCLAEQCAAASACYPLPSKRYVADAIPHIGAKLNGDQTDK